MVTKTFIAFFDLMGYSAFVENNEMTHVTYRVDHILRDIEFSLSLGKSNMPKGGIVTADRSQSRVNCLNISDSIIFWTNESTAAEFEEIIEVCYNLNWKMAKFNFPIRGALTYGDLGVKKWDDKNNTSHIYRGNVLYGKGLILAHQIAASMQWSGSMIDYSIFKSQIYAPEKMQQTVEKYAVKYRIPYKNGIKDIDEYAFMLSKPNFSEEALKNGIECIETVFSSDNKDATSKDVELKIKNTIEFFKFLQTYTTVKIK